jgi:ABC-2 type transport system permease protein
MRAEIAKLRALPTGRWTAGIVLGLVAFAFLALIVWGGDKRSDYEDTIDSIVAVTNIAAIVIGVWMVGLEYGQNTLRRTLTADPRRSRLVASKLGAGLGGVALLSVVAMIIGAGLFSVAASVHGAGSPIPHTLDVIVGAVIGNLLFAALGLGVALITRSMAGGMTTMLALVFIVDLILAGISGASRWSFGNAVSDIVDAVNKAADNASITHAILVLVLWIGIALGGGWARFARTDVA